MTGVANALRFNVVVDGTDLGSFTAMDGLSAEYDVTKYEEGGENGFVHLLPGRLRFGNIKLTRPVDMQSKGLSVWFGQLAKGQSSGRRTATVAAFDDNGEKVAEWNFVDVWPVRYTGPSLSAETARVATESFEFAHHGFSG